MFTLKPTNTFKVQVRTNTPLESGGFREETFIGIFERFSEEERDELISMKYVDVLRKKMKGWEMSDQNRETVPFTPENFESFLQLSGAVRDACQTYFNTNIGVKQKN